MYDWKTNLRYIKNLERDTEKIISFIVLRI